MSRPTEIASLLPSVFGGKPLGKRLHESSVWRVWDRAVGPQIAAKAQPVSFRDGLLTVAVTSAPWLKQIGFLKRQLIAAVNTALGEDLVREIYLKAGTLPNPPEPPPPPRPTRDLTPEEVRLIREESAAVTDDDLREALVALRRAHLRTSPKPDQ